MVTEAAAGDLLCLAVGGCGGGGDPFFLPLFPSAAAQLADEIPDMAAAGRRRQGSGKERKRDDWEKLRETERERGGNVYRGSVAKFHATASAGKLPPNDFVRRGIGQQPRWLD